MTEVQHTEQPTEYAIVELMGHVRHVGRVTEVERFGTKMGRVDIPKDGKFDNGFVTVFFSGAAIYRVTPCDLETVERANKVYSPGRLDYRNLEEDDDDSPTLFDDGGEDEDVSAEGEKTDEPV